MKKIAWRILQFSILVLFLCIISFLRNTLPLINGYAAKTMCSGIFVCGRTLDDIQKKELGTFPFNLSSCSVNVQDSSVTASVAGLAQRKAIFRKGLGATLISHTTEAELKSQSFKIVEPPAVNQDSIDWPAGNRITKKAMAGIDSIQLNAVINDAFTEPSAGIKRRTRAVVILYKDNIIAEKYADGFTATSKQLGWSMTKGIENALMGIMVRQGKVNIESPAPVDEWKNDERGNITLADLMHMSSGLHYASSATGPSDLTRMLFEENNMAAFASSAAADHPHGKIFHYADASANLLSFIERKLIGDSAYYRFPYKELFYKIGMNSALLEADGSGTFVGSSYCYATARDWARFGLLYLNDGVCNGERILPEGWVTFTATRGIAKNEEKKGEYGALWWLNARNNSGILKYPHVPADCFACQGYEGQYVWVIPSKKLVVVRLALERGNKLDADKFLSGIIKSLP